MLLCSGKVYYDLGRRAKSAGATDTAIVRVERLYPLPVDEIKAELAKYPADAEVVWVQDEPANMGAWPFMALKLPHHIEGLRMSRISRPASSSPAVGSAKLHEAEQEALIAGAFAGGTARLARPPGRRRRRGGEGPGAAHRGPRRRGRVHVRKKAESTHVLHRPGHRGADGSARRGGGHLTWLAERLREFVDLNPEFETPVDRLATWLARLDDEDDDE